MASSAVCACSVLPNTATGYSLRTTQRSHCAYLPGVSGRPESFRDIGDARIVSLCATTIVCTARAKDYARPLAVRGCGKLGANNDGGPAFPTVAGAAAHLTEVA